MTTTLTEITLSPAYRRAQRALAAWLDSNAPDARRSGFRTRAALAALNRIDHARMVRWLGWLCLAAASQGNPALGLRIQRLDAALGSAVDAALARLPTLALPAVADDTLRRTA
ncbi:MAG TPA: hypothetical protein VFJ04_06445 [Rhodanobacteraceae bacterium]|jgi:hypothetical protein|nr:hypothetical protein [Rhodanobacteraceae bacterium]